MNNGSSPTGHPPCPELPTPRPIRHALIRGGAFILAVVELALNASGAMPEYSFHGDGVRAMRPFESRIASTAALYLS